jgi:hypothetical protein
VQCIKAPLAPANVNQKSHSVPMNDRLAELKAGVEYEEVSIDVQDDSVPMQRGAVTRRTSNPKFMADFFQDVEVVKVRNAKSSACVVRPFGCALGWVFSSFSICIRRQT